VTVVAGIDEAGYGPFLGPLVVASSAFRLAEGVRPSALDRLIGLTEKAGGLAIDDSKQLYRGRGDLRRIEASTLGHAVLARGLLPLRVGALLANAVDLHLADLDEVPWYRGRLLQLPLPCEAEIADLLARSTRQSELLADRGLSFDDFSVAPVIEPRFNQQVRQYGSKAWPLFLATGRLIDRLIEMHPADELIVHVDRQGGRTHYGDLLAGFFPLARLRVLRERSEESVYRLEPGSRPAVQIHFHVQGDGRHAPVALASVVAKTVRELFMRSLNGWFSEQVPGLRPTAGYALDARRFLVDVAETLDRSAPRSQLIRIH
jgi:ribonuclease HII